MKIYNYRVYTNHGRGLIMKSISKSIAAVLNRYHARLERSNRNLVERCLELLKSPDGYLSNISMFASVIIGHGNVKFIWYPEFFRLSSDLRLFVVWHEIAHIIYHNVRDTSKASPIFIEVMCDLLAIKKLEYSFEDYKRWNLGLQEAYQSLIDETNEYLIGEKGYKIGDSGITELSKRLELVEEAMKRKE